MIEILNVQEVAKSRAAKKAVELVKDGWVVGLGSGSTMNYAIAELASRIKREKLNIYAVPSSYQTYLKALEKKIPITTLDEHPIVDIAIDGADEVDRKLNLIKGGGAALTREKIIAYASKKYVIIVDESKLVGKLGSRSPIPIEVLPFAYTVVMRALSKYYSKLKIRVGKGKVGPIVTDNGNFIVDIFSGEINDPANFERILKNIPGIIETGLFIDMADIVYIGSSNGKVKMLKASAH